MAAPARGASEPQTSSTNAPPDEFADQSDAELAAAKRNLLGDPGCDGSEAVVRADHCFDIAAGASPSTSSARVSAGTALPSTAALRPLLAPENRPTFEVEDLVWALDRACADGELKYEESTALADRVHEAYASLGSLEAIERLSECLLQLRRSVNPPLEQGGSLLLDVAREAASSAKAGIALSRAFEGLKELQTPEVLALAAALESACADGSLEYQESCAVSDQVHAAFASLGTVEDVERLNELLVQLRRSVNPPLDSSGSQLLIVADDAASSAKAGIAFSRAFEELKELQTPEVLALAAALESACADGTLEYQESCAVSDQVHAAFASLGTVEDVERMNELLLQLRRSVNPPLDSSGSQLLNDANEAASSARTRLGFA